jgi:ABC-2 type transport system permease protein
MLANVFMKANRDRAIGMLIGSGVIGALLLWGMSIYRNIDTSFYEAMPAAFRSLMGIPEGADAASLSFGAIYGFMGAMTLAGLAISMGSASIAGEERDGTIGLLLGNPLSRSRVLAAKAESLLLLTVVGVAILWLAGMLAPSILGVEVGNLDMTAYMVHLFANTLFYGFLALAIGAWSGNGSLASGVAVALMVIGYLAVGVLPLIEGAAGWEKIFPWYYFDGGKPALNGIDWQHVGLLGGASVVFAGVGFAGVNRRDLRTKATKTTIVDRLRADPRTAKIIERLAGSARVSSLSMKTASDHQGLLITVGWIMAAMGLMMGPLFGLIPASAYEALSQFPDTLIAMIGGGDMSTPQGFFQAEIFSITAPVAVAVVTIAMGARALAGEEKNHTMGLLLANPISRSRIVVTKAGIMVVFSAAVGLVTFLSTWLGVLIGGVDIAVGGIAAASVLLALLGLAFGSVALLLSALTGRTSIASYGTTGVVLVWYFLWAFASIGDSSGVWARLSPFHYYLGGDPLNNGMQWGDAAVLAAAFVACVAVAVWAFNRRDLRG